MIMFISNSYLLTIFLYSFVCFHVTADLHMAETGVGEFKQISKDPLKRRDAYQNPLLNNQSPKLSGEWIEDVSWPVKNNIHIGQVVGVTVNGRGEVLVFHRGSHVWNSFAFDANNVYQPKSDGPISDPTVLIFHPESGILLQQWGENMFFLPHGITVDQEENLWLTDVALHQVFKFPPLHKNERAALLTLGKAFTPGNSAVRFCKPTSVAVTPVGDFFVADGYCNSRIVKFNKHGEKILEFGQATRSPSALVTPGPYQFNIPHALTLAEERKLVCVADRENGRVLCYNSDTGKEEFQISAPQIGSRVYSVKYSPVEGGIFVLVNGFEIDRLYPVKVQTYVVSASTRHILSNFGNLQTPHDLAISPDARNIYVVEIGPNVIHKYTYNGTFNSTSSNITALDSSIKVPSLPQALNKSTSLRNADGTVLPAVLVTCAAILFGATIIVAALVYSRARRRGMSKSERTLRMETIRLVEDDDNV